MFIPKSKSKRSEKKRWQWLLRLRRVLLAPGRLLLVKARQLLLLCGEALAQRRERNRDHRDLRALVALARQAHPLDLTRWRKRCNDETHLMELRYAYENLLNDKAWDDFIHRLNDLAEKYQHTALTNPDKEEREIARCAYCAVVQILALPIQVQITARDREKFLMGYDSNEISPFTP